MRRALVLQEHGEPWTQKDFIAFYNSPSLYELVRQGANDKTFRPPFQDFLHKATRYTLETHRCLDFAGASNMGWNFNEANGSWKFQMIDPLVSTEPMLESLPEHLRTFERYGHLEMKERAYVLNQFNVVSTLNGLNEIFDIDERIDPWNLPGTNVYSRLQRPKDSFDWDGLFVQLQEFCDQHRKKNPTARPSI